VQARTGPAAAEIAVAFCNPVVRINGELHGNSPRTTVLEGAALGTALAKLNAAFRGHDLMPGLIYTFERKEALDAAAAQRRISTDAIIAIAMAANGQRGISFEELTEAGNPAPMVAVVFLDNESMHTFNGRIEGALGQHGVRIRKVQLTEGLQMPKPPVVDAEPDLQI